MVVWSADGRDIAYLPYAGVHPTSAAGKAVASSITNGLDHLATVEYLLETGGGGYNSMTLPESCSAASFEEACAAVARRLGLADYAAQRDEPGRLSTTAAPG